MVVIILLKSMVSKVVYELVYWGISVPKGLTVFLEAVLLKLLEIKHKTCDLMRFPMLTQISFSLRCLLSLQVIE